LSPAEFLGSAGGEQEDKEEHRYQGRQKTTVLGGNLGIPEQRDSRYVPRFEQPMGLFHQKDIFTVS
jgi:hypothetical protein